MTTHQLLILTNPVEGRDDEFNEWYDGAHLKDVLQVPGIVGAQRLTVTPGNAWSYATLYELDGDDPHAVIAELNARAQSGQFTMTDAIDMSSYKALVLSPYRP